jgi:hypothetical protein
MVGKKHVRGMATALVAVAGVFGGGAAWAGENVQSGSRNGLTWEARSRIVGQTPTGTGTAPNNGPGDPIYLGTASQYRGTVGLLMNFGSAGSFVCSGSLLSDRRSIATAAHCVSDGAGTANPLSTTVFFYDGSNTNASIYSAGTPGVTTRTVGAYAVNSGYTGEVIDQNDIAVLTLTDLAPAFANSYELYTGDLTGQNFNVAGYGNRSAVGGREGTTGAGAGQGTGRLRQGDNRYDFRMGDSDFNGFFVNTDPADPACGPTDNYFCGSADIDFSFVSDFDNGLAANDASCFLAQLANPSLAGNPKYCNTGVGAREVGIAGGDSGGPGFVNGQLASINSYGLSFGTSFGDFKAGLNDSWGEFSGYVPVSIHRDFIMGAMQTAVPEPGTWGMMLMGFFMVGAGVRTRRRTSVTYA